MIDLSRAGHGSVKSGLRHREQPIEAHQRRRRLWLIARRTVFGAAVVSVAVHLIIALGASIMTLRFGGGGDAGGDVNAVEFAVMTSEEFLAAGGGEASAAPPAAPSISITETLAIEAPTADTTIALDPQVTDAELDFGAGDSDEVDGELSELGGGGGGASFFGLEAQGERFAYIVDFSSSMTFEGRIERLRHEVSRSLQGLRSSSEFIVIPYSDGAILFDRPPRWREATERNVARVTDRLSDRRPEGGTKPLEAFAVAFRLKPPPDAIYFMTDGAFIEENVPEVIQRLNSRDEIPIHCILFGSASSATQDAAIMRDMKLIADQSGGRFTRVRDR